MQIVSVLKLQLGEIFIPFILLVEYVNSTKLKGNT